MNFKEICKLFGGQSATSEAIGLKDKSARNVRRHYKANTPVNELPTKWMPALKEEAKRIAKEMTEFSKNGTCT